MSAIRMEKINNEIQRALSTIIQQKVKNPDIVSIVSILNVKTTPDLKESKVYLSIFDSDKEKAKKTFGAILQSAAFIRRELARTIIIRQIPELKFILSDDIEYGMNLSKTIEELNIKKDDE